MTSDTDRIAASLIKKGLLPSPCPAPGPAANEREQACLDMRDVFGCRRLVKAVSWAGLVAVSGSGIAATIIWAGISNASASAEEAGKAAVDASVKADRAAAQIDRVGSELKIRLDAQKETLDRILAHMKQP